MHPRIDVNAGVPLRSAMLAVAALLLGAITAARADSPQPWREVNRRATQAIHLGQFAEGERLALDALRGCPAAGAEDLLCTSISLQNAAEAAVGLGRPADAEADLRRALAVRRAGLAEDHPLIADEELRLGMFLHQRNRSAEAEPLFADAATIMRRAGMRGANPGGADTLIVILSWDENALSALGRATDALAPAAEAQMLATQVHGATSEPALLAATNRIVMLRRADLSDQALNVALSVLGLPGIESVAPHWRIMLAGQAAQAAHEVGQPDPARTVATAALTLAEAPGADAASTVTLLLGLSRLALDAGEDAAAFAYANRAVVLARGVLPGEAGVTLLERGLARLALGDAAGALVDLDAAPPSLTGPGSLADRIRAVTAAVRAETLLGDPSAARARLEAALAAETTASPATRGILLGYLATTYQALGDPTRAVAEQGRAVALLEGVPGFEAGLIAAYRTLAVMRLDLDDVAGAQEVAGRAIAVPGDAPAIVQERPAAFAVAARVAAYALQVPQGLAWAQQAATLIDAMHSDTKQAAALGTLAAFYGDIAQTPPDGARAAAFADRARAAYVALGVHDQTLAAATREFGEARIWQHRAAEGETLCRDAEAQYRGLRDVPAQELARTASCIGWAQYAQGAFAAAEQTLNGGMTLLRGQPRADAIAMVAMAERHGLALRDLGRLDDARQALMAAREEALVAGAGGTIAYAGLLASLGSVLRRTDDVEAARAIDTEALTLLDRTGSGGGDTGLIRATLLDSEGLIAQGGGRSEDAARLLGEAAELRRERVP